ncbi:MAG: class II fructose-bisphosphate aldolase [Oscillospiraceae bacterium]|nr:class II fructose-bisphosphate aldolase [Oscillospiraceae bacterium]
MLVNIKTILAMAEQGEYAVPAFNVYNLETLMGVVEAAEELHAPVIIQSYSRLFKEGSAFYLAPAVLAAAKRSSVPICFHIDHGASEMETTMALRYGCSGVMIDASALPFKQNVELTRRVVETAGHVGVPVEGELGHVGTVNDSSMEEFTDVIEAKDFVASTGVAALAVLVGTAHGRYKKPPKIDIQRIVDIKAATGIPLVLHGGSGIPDDEIRAAIRAGIRKVNFGTDVCYAFLDAVFETSRDVFAIDLFMKPAVKSVKAFAECKIKLLGANGKA